MMDGIDQRKLAIELIMFYCPLYNILSNQNSHRFVVS